MKQFGLDPEPVHVSGPPWLQLGVGGRSASSLMHSTTPHTTYTIAGRASSGAGVLAQATPATPLAGRRSVSPSVCVTCFLLPSGDKGQGLVRGAQLAVWVMFKKAWVSLLTGLHSPIPIVYQRQRGAVHCVQGKGEQQGSVQILSPTRARRRIHCSGLRPKQADKTSGETGHAVATARAASVPSRRPL